MKALQIILLGLTLCGSIAQAQEYYPEYRGDHRARYLSFHLGMTSALGNYRSHSLAGNGLAMGMYRGGSPLVEAYNFLPDPRMKLSYEIGWSISANRINSSQIGGDANVSPVDTTRFSHWNVGVGLRFIYQFKPQVALELRGGPHLATFFTPDHFKFYYNTALGSEIITTTYSRRAQMVVAPMVGAAFRVWYFGLNIEYWWFRFGTDAKITAEKSGIISEINHQGRVQNLRITLAYYLPK